MFYTDYSHNGNPVPFKTQKAYSLTDSGIYTRNYWGNTWTAWVREDSFNCATASDLASLLGEGLFKRCSNPISIKDTEYPFVTCVAASDRPSAVTTNDWFTYIKLIHSGNNGYFSIIAADSRGRWYKGESSGGSTITWTSIFA